MEKRRRTKYINIRKCVNKSHPVKLMISVLQIFSSVSVQVQFIDMN